MRKAEEDMFKKNIEVMELLTSYPAFQTEIGMLRDILKIPQLGFKDEKEAGVWYEKLLSNESRFSVFNLKISKMTSQFNLGQNFSVAIEKYLVFNKILAPGSLSISLDYDEFYDQKFLAVKVYGEAREHDWRMVWSRIKKLQKHLPNYNVGRFREKTNLKTEKIAYEMSMRNISQKEIGETLHQKGLGRYDADGVASLISNFKSRLSKFDPR